MQGKSMPRGFCVGTFAERGYAWLGNDPTTLPSGVYSHLVRGSSSFIRHFPDTSRPSSSHLILYPLPVARMLTNNTPPWPGKLLYSNTGGAAGESYEDIA